MVYNGYHPELSLQNPSQLGPPGPQNKRNGRNEKMKTWKRALALVLALVMALSLVALPSFAAGEDEETGSAVTDGRTSVNGLELRKVYDPETSMLTLEAYATGSTTTTVSKDPVDIVLVLDVSGSMDDYMETYSISPGGTYYYYAGSYSGYKRAYYCSSCEGWYTKEHGNHNKGKQLFPKTSASDTNTSRTQFYSDVTKMDALKTAVKGFVNSVKETSPESKIAIVKFGGKIKNEIGDDRYTYSRESINYTQTVKELTPASSAAELNTAVDALQHGGFTPAHLGLQLAKGIIENEPNTDRQKVVVLFTDGEPNGVKDISGFESAAANQAIANSKSIKDAGATVYTIGVFDGANPSQLYGSSDGNVGSSWEDDSAPAVNRYMNYVSSNFKTADDLGLDIRGYYSTTYEITKNFERTENRYYLAASSAADLNNIFQDISHTIGGATLTLGTETVLKDVVSDYFDLPENASSQITAKSYSCTELDASGNPIWSNTADDKSYNVEVNGKTVTVKGFDYSNNWVGKNTTTGDVHPGKKLVVTIPIVDNGTGMGTVPTNDTTSAVYDGEKSVCNFAVPTAYFPYFTVTHIQSNVDDNGKNYGKYAGSTKHRVPTDGTKFNLTSVVTANYLYGGTFNEETCTTVHNKVKGQNPMAIAPVENETYYIWEVPDTYLRPFGYWISRHLEGGQGTLSVTQLYLLAAVDRVNYADAGLKVSFGNGTSQYISSSCEELSNPNTEQLGSATVYQMLETVKGHAGGEVIDTWYLKNGIPVNYEGPLTKSEETGKYLDANDGNNSPIDDGCIIGHRLKGEKFKSFQKSGVTYRPYWVTLDGVRVEGVRSRNYTFVVGSADPGKPSKDVQLPAVYQYLEKQQSAQTLTLRTNLLAGDTEPAVNDLTVTVIDGSNAPQTIKVAPNGSVRDQVAYQAPAGKVFAGWFTDDSFTTPADLDQVTQDTTIYAKYVSDSYLDLDYSRTGLFRLRGVTLISAVDNPANYQVSGFIVGDQKVDVSYVGRYRIFKTPANLFGAARDAKLMLADKSLSGTGTLEVTPYWITLDGTEVHGVTHTLHYNTRTIWE